MNYDWTRSPTQPDRLETFDSGYFEYDVGDDTIFLDGHFTAEELRKVSEDMAELKLKEKT